MSVFNPMGDSEESLAAHIAVCENPMCPIGKPLPVAVQWSLVPGGIEVAVIASNAVVHNLDALVVGSASITPDMMSDEIIDHLRAVSGWINNYLQSVKPAFVAETDQLIAGINNEGKNK